MSTNRCYKIVYVIINYVMHIQYFKIYSITLNACFIVWNYKVS